MERVVLVFMIWFVTFAVYFIVMKMIRQYLFWKDDCKRMLLSANDDYCMCGDRIDAHNACGDHAPLSEYEWAVKNLPELKLG